MNKNEEFKENLEGENPSTPSNTRTQYGKKGFKPRHRSPRPTVDLDTVVTNNVEYWNKSTGYNNVTKFRWDLILGNPKNISGCFDKSQISLGGEITDPILNPANIMAIDVVMGPGWAANTSDGVNRGLAQIMASIRSSLSTSNIGFETADLGIYLASTSSIAASIGLAKKILGLTRMWKDRNMVFPRAILQAYGLEYNDLIAEKQKYYARLHSIIDRYNNMRIPDISDCYDRQYVLMHNIYADEDSELAQIYVFRPTNYYTYADDAVPSRAVSNNWPNWDYDRVPFDEILDRIDDMIDRWYNSSDLYQINGTLLRAFKDAPRQVMPDLDESAETAVEVDRAHLMQIMNCTIIGNLDSTSLDITQDGTTQNFIKWMPKTRDHDYDGSVTSAVLRLFEDDISQDDNMELSRLLCLFKEENKAGDIQVYSGELKNCGSEIVNKISVHKYNTLTNTSDVVSYVSNTLFLPENADIEEVQLFNKRIAYMSPFRYIPCIYLTREDDASRKFDGILGDVYNWCVYDIVDYANLQFQAYWSLWKPKINLDN